MSALFSLASLSFAAIAALRRAFVDPDFDLFLVRVSHHLSVKLKEVENCRLIFGGQMEIVNFFEKMAGRWFSQRTTHALSTQQSKAGKSDLEVDFLAADASEVQQLCESAAAGKTPLCGLKIQQSSTIEGDTKPTNLTTLLVPLSVEESVEESVEAPNQYNGSFVRSGKPGQPSQQGTYSLEDEVLTMTTETEEATSTERLWFINDNLRMRTGITELASGLRIASFCSEIRMGVKPPKAD